jgi:hypothetical protein
LKIENEGARLAPRRHYSIPRDPHFSMFNFSLSIRQLKLTAVPKIENGEMKIEMKVRGWRRDVTIQSRAIPTFQCSIFHFQFVSSS